jgi:hypothetical protein
MYSKAAQWSGIISRQFINLRWQKHEKKTEAIACKTLEEPACMPAEITESIASQAICAGVAPLVDLLWRI